MIDLNKILNAHKAGDIQKDGKEYHWEDEYNNEITVEIISIIEDTYIVRDYWDSGNLYSLHSFKCGKQHGIQVEYYETGDIEFQYTCVDGLRHGESLEFDEHGKTISKYSFTDGLIEMVREV